tara:strand:+ start:175 stop:567 length:393 start_codon:yes stop_codon:yes gene_type:complete
MIYISPTYSRAVYLMLKDKCLSLTPYFTFEFINDSTNDYIYACANDFSTSPYWSGFTFSIVSGTAGLTQGQVNLKMGEHKYNVYEMSTQYNLNVNQAVRLVDTGICLVGNTYSNILSSTQSVSQYRIIGL